MVSIPRNSSKYGMYPLHVEWIIPPLEGLTPLALGGLYGPPKWSRPIWPVLELRLTRILRRLACCPHLRYHRDGPDSTCQVALTRQGAV